MSNAQRTQLVRAYRWGWLSYAQLCNKLNLPPAKVRARFGV